MGALFTWLMGGAASAALGGVTSIAGKVADGWAAKQKAMTDQHGITTKAATEITVEGFRTDTRFAELQATLALADRADRRTSWIRPAYVAPAWFWFVCLVLNHTMPGVAKFIGIQVTDLPFPFDYLAIGIPLAIFGLRPFEKSAKANTVTKAQATIAQANAAKK
jgi:hypothetical protein